MPKRPPTPGNGIDYVRYPAIPTVYQGRRYRSRLEARWAAFFDLVGWKFEYEPYDLGRWSPDFMLCGTRDVPVEVKPLADFDREIGRKIADTAAEAGMDHALLLGKEPFGWSSKSHASIGWVAHTRAEAEHHWSYALFLEPPASSVRFDLSDFHCPFSILLNVCDLDHPHEGMVCPWETIRGLWVEAANRVQWKPKGASR